MSQNVVRARAAARSGGVQIPKNFGPQFRQPIHGTRPHGFTSTVLYCLKLYCTRAKSGVYLLVLHIQTRLTYRDTKFDRIAKHGRSSP